MPHSEVSSLTLLEVGGITADILLQNKFFTRIKIVGIKEHRRLSFLKGNNPKEEKEELSQAEVVPFPTPIQFYCLFLFPLETLVAFTFFCLCFVVGGGDFMRQKA